MLEVLRTIASTVENLKADLKSQKQAIIFAILMVGVILLSKKELK